MEPQLCLEAQDKYLETVEGGSAPPYGPLETTNYAHASPRSWVAGASHLPGGEDSWYG